MTEASSIKPVITLRGSEFVIELEPPNKAIPDSVELRVNCHDQSEFSIQCKPQPSNNGRLVLSAPVQSIRIPSLSKALLIWTENALDISGLFLSYQLDRSKLDDNVYLINNLFNASARNYSSDDLFVVTYAYLNTLPLDNHNFGGLITILSYRITDKLDERANLLEAVYATYRHYREKVQAYDAVAFRWLVSSSSALTTALLCTGSVVQAADVVDDALKAIIHPSFNPMTHQNFALLLFQGGLIKAWNGRFDEAASLFIGAVNAGRHGMSDLLHPQNNWLLSQLSDCRKFLQIIEAAHCAALACSRNKLPPESRFGVIKSAPKLQINFKVLFDRFECCKKTTPPFFEQVLLKMQAHQNGHIT